jgi:hypothetical protein
VVTGSPFQMVSLSMKYLPSKQFPALDVKIEPSMKINVDVPEASGK